MRFKYFTILTLFFVAIQLQASKYPQHQLGINYSTISGTGLSYRLMFDRANTLQFTMLPYYEQEDQQKDYNFTIIAGVEYQRNIYLSTEHRIYGFASASLWYFEDRGINIVNPNTDLEYTVYTYDKDVFHNLGIGIGYDYTLNKIVSFNLSLGLQYQTTQNDSFDNFMERTNGKQSFVGIGGGAGIFFHL